MKAERSVLKVATKLAKFAIFTNVELKLHTRSLNTGGKIPNSFK